MSSESHRLMEQRRLGADQMQERETVFDGGAYNKLQVQGRVAKAASGACYAKIQHAAVQEPDSWEDISGASIDLYSATPQFLTIENFLRYIRWVTDSAVAGDPVASIDLIAKQ